MTNIFAKITDEVILRDAKEFMGPAALRVFTYGLFSFIGFSILCSLVLNNIIPHSSKWVCPIYRTIDHLMKGVGNEFFN